jgi:KaiC/GvpD/RAD55 family RecA-like ATPase
VDGKADFQLNGIAEPDWIIQSSTEHNRHLYWRIEESISNESVEDTNRRLTYFLEADSSGWDITQVLRPPGTINHKPGKELPVKVLRSESNLVHTLSEFDKAPTVPTFTPIQLDDIPQADQVLLAHRLPTEIYNLVTKELPVHQDRSSFLMNAGYLLAEAGLAHSEIVSLIMLMDARVRKFFGRADALDRISQLASIAVLKVQSKARTVEFYTLQEILTSDRKLEWFIEGILPKKGFAFVTAPPGTGKTVFLSDMLYALSSGTSFIGFPSCEPVECIYFSIEMFFEEQKYFWEMQVKGWEKYELFDKNVKTFFDKDVDEPFIEAIIKNFRPSIVIIDSMADLIMDAKEEEARRITKFLLRMRELYNVSFVIIHHNRKNDNTQSVRKPRGLSDLYGSYILARSCQTVLSLWKDEKKSYFELDALKGRFMGDLKTIHLARDENLNYKRITVDVSGNSGTIGKGTVPLTNFLEFGGS